MRARADSPWALASTSHVCSSVNLATRRLYKKANTPSAILALGEEGLKDYIRTIGLFNSKAKNIIATCKTLLDDHGGEVPSDRPSLEALPGVGRKTANVVLGTAFGIPTGVVVPRNEIAEAMEMPV